MPSRLFSQFALDQAGAVAPTYAIAITALVAVAGVGFDYTRMAALDTELQNAADQAALAGASQLDGKALSGTTPGACARAAAAVTSYVANNTRFANDGGAPLVTFPTSESTCDATGSIRFWQDKDKTNAATNDANARFVEVITDARVGRYALTPVVGAFGASMSAAAMAGLGSSVCKVPPIMICNPDGSLKPAPFNADARVGQGIVATGHGTGQSGQTGNAGTATNNTWSPGDFGFLQVQDSDPGSQNAKLLKALAYVNPPIDCISIENNQVNTGNPQGLYDAINTRFDIYDFPSNGGNTLADCQGGACPPSSNVVKDFQNSNSNTNGNNTCKIGNGGWQLPVNEYYPIASAGPSYQDSNRDGVAGDYSKTIATGPNKGTWTMQMGLPRDLCHYTSYNGTGVCAGGAGGRIGDGNWDRYDYFMSNHGTNSANWPSDWSTITRYNTYRWELGSYGTGGSLPTITGQRSSPICFKGSPSLQTPDRRVLTVAIVNNCSTLTGTSTAVDIGEWADVFLVEPSTDDAKRYNHFADAIYMEVIGKSKVAGSGTYNSQQVRRDVPYLVR